MDSVKHSSNKSRLARAFSKVLHSRAAAAAGLDNFQKTKSKTWEKFKHEKPVDDKTWQPMVLTKEDEKLRKRAVMDAFFAKLFADISSVKAAYAQLQVFQSPYDGDGIQSADKMIVSELKNLSELKQAFLKKHIDDSSPETTQLLAEIQEQKNQLKMYEITRKKLDNQNKLKESEIIFLKEKLEESRRENKLIEKRLNSSGSLSTSSHEILNFSSLTPTIFITYVKQTTKSVRSFVKFMISEMEAANWDLDAAASSIQPDVIYFDTTHICYAFESFVCRQMYDGFNLPGFQISVESQSIPKNETRRQFFFDKFMELKSLKVREYITWKPTSMFAEFCRCKYLKLVHPKMESSLFGNLNQRNQVNSRKFPETAFFDSFLEVSKRVWLLHCLAFSFSPKEASIFQITKGSRFSEVFMESVNEEAFLSPKCSPEVAFMVVPGFMVSKTVIQCQVYLI
uniref:protein GRAVITROPIC IN THE LIGHT 1-like n=1 Tax=Erigeron canadensis TaxID=72917 RepID=UPI001CB98901|nr:protein GRAVITROPIC IN THE LIGHT 1-like [Erigeron canadensis]